MLARYFEIALDKTEAMKRMKDVVDLDKIIEEFTCWQEVCL